MELFRLLREGVEIRFLQKVRLAVSFCGRGSILRHTLPKRFDATISFSCHIKSISKQTINVFRERRKDDKNSNLAKL